MNVLEQHLIDIFTEPIALTLLKRFKKDNLNFTSYTQKEIYQVLCGMAGKVNEKEEFCYPDIDIMFLAGYNETTLNRLIWTYILFTYNSTSSLRDIISASNTHLENMPANLTTTFLSLTINELIKYCKLTYAYGTHDLYLHLKYNVGSDTHCAIQTIIKKSLEFITMKYISNSFLNRVKDSNTNEGIVFIDDNSNDNDDDSKE